MMQVFAALGIALVVVFATIFLILYLAYRRDFRTDDAKRRSF